MLNPGFLQTCARRAKQNLYIYIFFLIVTYYYRHTYLCTFLCERETIVRNKNISMCVQFVNTCASDDCFFLFYYEHKFKKTKPDFLTKETVCLVLYYHFFLLVPYIFQILHVYPLISLIINIMKRRISAHKCFYCTACTETTENNCTRKMRE